MGSSGTFISVPFMAYAQESFSPEKLGKVFSMWFTTMSLAMPVGLLVAGPVSEVVGVDKRFFWSGVLLRLEYLSPSQRSELSIPAIYVGSEGALITMLFRSNGFSLLFSLILIFIGMVMGIISLVFVRKIEEESHFYGLDFSHYPREYGYWANAI